MDQRVVVVSGEAPESDDETASIKTGVGVTSNTPNPCGTIISGEAPESDDDGLSLSSTSGIDAVACSPYNDGRAAKSRTCIKYNSLLHRKLHECNQALERDIRQMVEGTIFNNLQELNAANRQLLKSESTLQEAACQLRSAFHRSRDVANALIQIADGNFFHSIKT